MEDMQSIWRKLYLKAPTLGFDILAVPVSLYLAYVFRYNLHNFEASNSVFSILAFLFPLQVFAFYKFKVYRGLWQFTSIQDILRIIKSVLFAVILVVPVLYAARLLRDLPRSVLPLYAGVLIAFLCLGRLAIRVLLDKKPIWQQNIGKKVLIIGAGKAGDSLARDLNRLKNYNIIGFVDDDRRRLAFEVQNIPVLGTVKDLPALVKKFEIELVLIAIPSIKAAGMRRIVELCEQTKVSFRTLPSVQDLASGKVEIQALRTVKIEDLLGREPVNLYCEALKNQCSDKIILVTGGGGSIGSELCRQIALCKPKTLLILDNHENSLFQIEQELKQKYSGLDFHLVLGSIEDENFMKDVFIKFRPNWVLHAAAYKHVPILEAHGRRAIRNNVFGTEITARISAEYKAEKFVLISTDKAVNPANMLGVSKRIAEIFCQSFNETVETEFIIVRFGNVLGSAGSVVPTFEKQLKQGGPLTVTHPDITRYFMTITEASQLILEAMLKGQGGEIFVLDMGEPVSIRYLAEQVIRLSNKEPYKDIEILYTGLRPGEKLTEELFYSFEELLPTSTKKLFCAKKSSALSKDSLTEVFLTLREICAFGTDDELMSFIKALVPEYQNRSEKLWVEASINF